MWWMPCGVCTPALAAVYVCLCGGYVCRVSACAFNHDRSAAGRYLYYRSSASERNHVTPSRWRRLEAQAGWLWHRMAWCRLVPWGWLASISQATHWYSLQCQVGMVGGNRLTLALTLWCWIYFGKQKHICILYHLSLWNTRTCSFCTVNTIAVDGLVKQGGRVSAAIILT